MASCQYCGIAHTNTEPHCASCGAPKSVSDIHWLKKEERDAALTELKTIMLQREGKSVRKMPVWGWVLILLFFGPFIFPLMIMLLVALFSMGWLAWPVILGAAYIGIQKGWIKWGKQAD